MKVDGYEYRIKPRTTFYRGVKFRSRLEARWAAMFDGMKWSWDYEPIDLHGWTPDFVIKGKQRDVFVEVKPTHQLSIEVAERLRRDYSDVCWLSVGNGPISPGEGSYNDDWWSLGYKGSKYLSSRSKGPFRADVLSSYDTGEFDLHIDGEPGEYLGFYTGRSVAVRDAEFGWRTPLGLFWKFAGNEVMKDYP